MNPLTAVETVATGFSPWRIVAVLVAVAALIGLGAWGGYTMARGYYEPKLSAANEQIGKLTTANAEMKAAVEHQNTAITALQAEAKKREQAATAAVQQAHKLAVKSQTRAQAVLLVNIPETVLLSAAFATGGGAQNVLMFVIRRLSGNGGAS